jgi:hypothetical protein
MDSKEPIPPGCVSWRASIDKPIPTRFLLPSPHGLFKNSSTELGSVSMKNIALFNEMGNKLYFSKVI